MPSKLVRAEKTLSGSRANFNFSVCRVKSFKCQVKSLGAEQVPNNTGNSLGAEHQEKSVVDAE